MFLILRHIKDDLWEPLPMSGEFFDVPEAKKYLNDMNVSEPTKIVCETFAELYTNPDDGMVNIPHWSDEQVEMGEDL